MPFFDHRYPVTSAPDQHSKTRRYFWYFILGFTIVVFLRVWLFSVEGDDHHLRHGGLFFNRNNLANSPPHIRTGGVPHRPHAENVHADIINDNLVEQQAEDYGDQKKQNDDDDDDHFKSLLSTPDESPLGMKGERLKQFFVVNQRNNRKPYSVPIKRTRMFDDETDKKKLNDKRLQKVREEFLWAWNSYRHIAWGYDELHSVSKRPRSWIVGMKGFAMTMFDALDTLYIMNLTAEFNEAVSYLYNDFNLYVNAGCSTFEATIRLLGGTLSSYELSNDIRLLHIAEKVGWILIAGLETSNGMLKDHVNFKTRAASSMGWLNGNNLVSELGSLQLEFRTLSFHVRDPIFDMRVTHLMSILKSGCEPRGYVCPTMFSYGAAEPSSSGYTLGGMADSYFEYVVKQYALTGGVETEFENMASRMLRTIQENMIVESRVFKFEPGDDDDEDYYYYGFNASYRKKQEKKKAATTKRETWVTVFPGYWSGRQGDPSTSSSLEHLTCFAGGMFAVAALSMKNLPIDSRQSFAQTAHDLTETCANMYFSQRSGLAPEEADIYGTHAFTIDRNEYRLRPETLESLFYMWRITGDDMYREWSWTIFDSMMKFCRMPWGGYSGIVDVSVGEIPDPEELKKGRSGEVIYDDLQQSYFMAETMKYLFLTFADPSFINLEEWVFNTEAHPLRIRQRDPRQIWYEWKEKHGNRPRWIAPKINGVRAFYPELDGFYK